MRPIHLLAVLAPPLLLGPAPAQTASAHPCVPAATWKAVIAEGKHKSRVMDHLDQLVNRIGPRLTSSDNLQNACEWARDRFRSFGIANARLEQWGSFPVGFNRGPWSGAVVAPAKERRALHFCTDAWTAGTAGRQRGRLARAPKDLAEARARKDELTGRWILRKRSRRGFRRFSSGNHELNRYLHEIGALGSIHSARGALLVTSGNRNVRFDRLPALPSITLRKDEYDDLVRMLDDGVDVEVAFDIRNWFRKGPIPVYNVLADIEGTEKPDEYVVVGGHLDSWDGATGATDNGTGTATTLEAARILMATGAKPRRTIRFMLWTGEEQGLLGSGAWCRKHRKLVREQVSACLVHDGGTGTAIGIQGFKNQLPLLRRAFAGFATIDPGFPFEVGEAGGVMPGSDHYSFHQAGAPGFFWVQDPSVNYTRTHHTQFDTYDAAHADMQRQTATVVALGALAIANLDDLLPRPPKNARMAMTMPISMVGIRLGKGMVVTKVQKDSRGAQMGLRKGDKLLTFNGRKLTGGERGFMRRMVSWVLSGAPKGKLVVGRDGREKLLEIPNPMAGR